VEKDIAAIVVTYNRKPLLLECIEALSQHGEEIDIFIIDNASTDGTLFELRFLIESKKIKYFNTKENLGGAGGFNYGVKQVMQEGGYKYLWLMDDDTIITSNTLPELLNAAEILQDNFGFLCSYVEWIDKAPCKMNIPDVNKEWILELCQVQKGLLCVERATFVSFFVRRQVVEEIGLPIKEFFIWGDDTNYSFRIIQKYPSFFVSKSVVIHKMNSNTSANIIHDNGDRLERYVYAYRNRFYNARIQHTLLKYFYRFAKVFVWVGLKSKNHRLKRWFYMCKGFMQGINFNPEIEYISPERREH